MPLLKIKDFDPDYREHFDNQDVIGYDLYAGDEKVGSVDDLLVDDTGKFRYLVVNTGVWIFGKKVLMPIGLSRISHDDRRVYTEGLTREQVENLPEFNNDLAVDYDHEERVRDVYRPMVGRTDRTSVDTANAVDTRTPLDTRTPADTRTPVDARTPINTGATGTSANLPYDRNTYTYDRDPSLYGLTDRNHQNLRLYEERLIASKTRRKTGEVAVGKRVETKQASASVPIEKERVVVERNKAGDVGQTVTPGPDAFQEGEVARMDIYEEVPDIRKETVVRENVDVRKEVDRETVDANEQVRREELDVKTQGNPNIDKRPRDAR